MKNSGQEHKNAGFTLLEMIVALLVLSISMGLAIQAIGIASRSIALADERNATVNLLDKLKAKKLPEILAAGKIAYAEEIDGMRWELTFTPTTTNLSDIMQGLAFIRIFPIKDQARHHDFAVFTSVKERER